jgi:transketolase
MGDLQGDPVSGNLYKVADSLFIDVVTAQSDDINRASAFAALARINALYMIARAGSGHIGSSFSSLDIVTWLYLVEMNHAADSPDIYFSSKGHDVPGLYSVLIGLGLLESKKLDQLRRLNGLPGHPDVRTPGIAFNSGSLGMGVSKAKGLLEADRLNGVSRQVFVLTGDGELQEGQFWESLQGAANRETGDLTVIIDHNKYQSDSSVEQTSDLGNLDRKFAAYGWHVERCDGHDYTALKTAIKAARKMKEKPSVIIADTIKGRGVGFMEHTSMSKTDVFYKFHSGAPSSENYLKAVQELIGNARKELAPLGITSPQFVETGGAVPTAAQTEQPDKLIVAYSDALIAIAGRDERIVALDADLILDTGLIHFRDRFPERFIECGIAEQDMVSQAGAMAGQGKLPFVHSFACFLTTRPNEQIYNNASENRKVVYVGSLAGILPAGPGHSHQAVRDIASLNGIPGLIQIQPSCEGETTAVVEWSAASTTESVYIRLHTLPTIIEFSLPENYKLEVGKGCPLTDGDDAILFAYGPMMLNQAMRIHHKLQSKGVHIQIINMPWLNRIDEDWLKEITRSFANIFTLDDHYIAGGQGALISSAIACLGLGIRTTLFGVDQLPQCGRNDEVLIAHGLDADTLVSKIELVLSQ